MSTSAEGPLRALPERPLISESDFAPTKSQAVCVRFGPDEMSHLKATAARTGQTVPSLLRSAWHYLAAADVAFHDKEAARG